MPRRIALIVGVSKYEPRTGLHNLSAPANDAQRVYEVLAEYGGFDELYPLPLANGKVDGSGRVTAQELRAKLHEVLNPQLADEVELAVFYFSGHGVNPDGQVAYLSTSDKSLAVAISHIAKLAKHSAVKNICIWLDCCHSGEMLEFSNLTDKGFCVVAASHADGEALAADGNSLLTNLLCEALTPLNGNPPEIRVMDFIQTIAAKGKNLPQQVVCLARGNTAFTLTQFHGETTVTSAYPPDYPPYKGLLTFTKDDSPFFFGRDGMIQQLLDKLSASRFVPLLGASGSGKSSLVLAGLLPKLPDSDWQVLVMRPTAQPLQNLRDTLVRGFPDAQVGTLASGADLQREVLRLVTTGKQLLLVIDQFEEVFTECRDDTARTVFFSCLLKALDGDNPLHLVLTLRADFLGHCTEQAYSGLGQRLQHHALLLVAPTAGELREAITRPLALVGMHCEQALEDELIDQTLHAKGSLPLLQYVLEKLWQSARQERSRELTLVMYQQLGGQHGGGLRGVLNEKADTFYQQLEPQHQRLMEWLMVELVQVNEGQEDTRRTVTLQELHHRQPQYTAALDALLSQLVTQERLLTKDIGYQEKATITVAHEALIRHWKKVQNWLDANHDIKIWRSRIEGDIKDWNKNGDGYLLQGERLIEALTIKKKYEKSLLIGNQELDFIDKSQKKQEAYDKERLRIYNELIVGKLTGKSALAIRSPSSANGSIEQGLLLAITAFKYNPTSTAALASLLDGLQASGHLRKIDYVNKSQENGVHAFWSKGFINKEARSSFFHYIIQADNNNSLSLWKWSEINKHKPNQEGEAWHGHTDIIRTVAFSHNGKYVVSGSNDRTLRLWDVSTGIQIGNPWNAHTSPVTAVTFSLDGLKVASGDNNGSIIIWDVIQKSCINICEKAHSDAINAISFSSDGYYIASGSEDCSLRLWSYQKGTETVYLWNEHKAPITVLSFSPQAINNNRNYFLLSADKEGRLISWKIVREVNELKKYPFISSWHWHDNMINAMAFSPSGRYAITSSHDHTIRDWDVSGGHPLCEWSEEVNGIMSAAFSPGEKNFAIGFYDGSLQLRFTSSGLIERKLIGHSDAINSLAYSPNGKYIATGSDDKSLILWSLEGKNTHKRVWKLHEGAVMSVAFNNDGSHIVSCGEDQKVILWDVSTGVAIKEYLLEKPKTAIFSQDKNKIIIADGNILLSLNTDNSGSTGKPWKERHKSPIECLAISKNGQHIITGSDNLLYLWDVKNEQIIGTPWRGHKKNVVAVDFSHDDRYVISASMDCNIRLWDKETGTPIGEPWNQHKDALKIIAISKTGHYLISAGFDHLLSLWDTHPQSWAKKACSIVNRNFSLAEWRRFIGDALPYEKTCPDLPAPGEEGWVEPYAGG